jgi:hypothetical protein
VPLPRVVLAILYGDFLRRLLSPIVALRSFGQGHVGILLAFRQVITPLVTSMSFHYVAAAPVVQPMTSRLLVGPYTGMLQRSFRDTPAPIERFRSQGANLTGGWTHPSLPTAGTTSLLIS